MAPLRGYAGSGLSPPRSERSVGKGNPLGILSLMGLNERVCSQVCCEYLCALSFMSCAWEMFCTNVNFISLFVNSYEFTLQSKRVKRLTTGVTLYKVVLKQVCWRA